MNFGAIGRKRIEQLAGLAFGLASMALPVTAFAQAAAAAPAASGYTPLGPDMIKGQPTPGGIDVQHQYSPIGEYAAWFHHDILVPMMIGISALVFILLIYVMLRFNKRANPVPSKVSHNTTLEVIWTGIPILILVAIAVPSVSLLQQQYVSAPKDALTVKVTGYQWYWGYTYPDNGGFEVISNMLPDDQAVAKGLPAQLAVDNRMVVPAGVPIRIQTTGADVIHSFALPSLWFKLDAVPGRLNEKVLYIDQPGIYYGQCSELCGARHGFMPIAVEAVPMDQFKAWVKLQGGTTGDEQAADPVPAETPAAAEAPATDSAAPSA